MLDIDPRHGGDRWFTDNRDRLPPTRTHETRSGGLHLLFSHHEGMRCSSGKIAPGVDVRADGGYIVWWPAAGYTVLDDSPITPWPEGLLDITGVNRPRGRLRPFDGLPPARLRHYATAALRKAILEMGAAPAGTRNATLNNQTYCLTSKFGDVLGVDRIATELARAALRAGLEKREIVRTLESALRAGGVA